MRSKFSLTLALSIVVLSVFGASAQTSYRERYDKKTDKQTRKQTSVRSENRVFIVSPGRVIVRPAVRFSIQPAVVRPVASSYFYTGYETDRDDKRYNGNVAAVARLNGYRDGLREGAKDAADGDRYDPFGEHAYKDGATGYISKYGNRAAYQRVYRQSFLRGYKESFDRYLGNYERRNW